MTAHELSASYDIAESGILPSLLTTCSPSKSPKNVNPKIVSEMLGHATISQTMDTYSTSCRGWATLLLQLSRTHFL